MRGSIVVLALAVTPLFASVSQAQNGHGPHWQRRWTPAARHDDDRRGRSDDKKCEDRSRGNPSANGLANRADPRAKGNKGCDLNPSSGGTDQSPPPPPPPPADTAGQTDIQGSLFFDVDHDGAFGPDEVGLAGWTVQVSGPVNASAVTDGNGAYSITGLIPGSYTVCVMAPMGWAQTAPGTGFGLPTCSNGTVGFGLDAPAVSGLTQYTGVDFGFVSM